MNWLRGLVLACWTAGVFTGLPSAEGRVLDDFNSGKSGWEDFSFNAALPLPQVEDGRFKFTLPPAGQAIFIASTKTTETFELKEGRSIEFRVDLVEGGGKDSFAVLAFIPTSTGASTLAGYGMAKSTTDILITKGIGKYFYNENPPEPVKNENVALSLTMTALGGNVILTARVLDLDNQEAVLFEKTVVDTPAADVMANGTDEPAAPYLTEGRFVLYLYQDFDANAPENPYQVTYDNAEVFVTDRALLDDFNSGKEGWEDFSFNAALPRPAVADGLFQFRLPPVGQAIFIASTKTTRTFELREGERLTFQVDLVEGGAKDSFAVLGFIPTSTGASTLAGYGLAKSTTDILITKGIGKYFYNEDPPEPIRNENVILSLEMTVRGGNVYLLAQVLDRDDPSVVLFEKRVVDTPAADVMANGTDDPAAPYITQGHFVLYLYQDFDAGAPEDPYRVDYDNAVVASAPAAANEPPVISALQPSPASNFLPASTTLSFTASDDAPLADGAFSIVLNGTEYTAANGLAVAGTGTTRTVSLAGVLEANVNYQALARVVDAEGVSREIAFQFDTFASGNRIIEVEDYNFQAGEYINDPVPYPEDGGPAPDTYNNQEGIRDVDYSDTRAGPNFTNTRYRTFDPIRMARTLDKPRAKFVAAGGPDAGVYDYDVGDIVAGEWMQYTRDFAPGTYEVYLRKQVVNLAFGESVLERVTGDRSEPDAPAQLLGTFLGQRGGFDYQNVPLTDGTGANRIVLRLSGTTTLRLRHVTTSTSDAYRQLNYMVFVPVPDPGVQRATVSATLPAAGTTVESVRPSLQATLANRDTTVNVGTVRLEVNGEAVPGAVVEATADGAVVRHDLAALPPSGSLVTARVIFLDSEGVEVSTEWSFTVTYRSLPLAARVNASGTERGFRVRVVQAPFDLGPLENSLDRAENQLAPNSSIPREVDVQDTVDRINFNKVIGAMAGFFEDDLPVPGIDPDVTGNGNNDFAVEILTYLELPAGVHRFGVVTDDGYKIAVARAPVSPGTAPLAFHNGGPANTTFDFVVPQSGFYAFRMVWYERAGAGHAEWFSVDPATGVRTLINDTSAPGGIAAWRTIAEVVDEVVVESAPAVQGPYAPEPAATVSVASRTATVPLGAGHRFFRLRGGSALTIQTVQVQGGVLQLTWQ
ncbi:MAG: hypothetical protein KF833_14835 [Verrucomicrobiae bacterium]|nr:hypothetical protein [Verrucomicrobiae bacterium]